MSELKLRPPKAKCPPPFEAQGKMKVRLTRRRRNYNKSLTPKEKRAQHAAPLQGDLFLFDAQGKLKLRPPKTQGCGTPFSPDNMNAAIVE
jgi:hypothetical protein